MQDNEFSLRGIGGIMKKLDEISKKFKELEFVMVYKDM
jgi:hypothetical protein